MNNPKKVLIACPTLGLESDPSKWLTLLLTVINDVRKNGMSHACIFPFRQTWWPANNFIWDAAFENCFDYILRLDDDVWGARPDAFTELLKADKDVIGSAYPLRQFPYSLCAFNQQDTTKTMIDIWNTQDKTGLVEVQGVGVTPVDLVGFGMTLIKVEPFRHLSRPIYQGAEVCPDDTYFAQLCKDNGIQQYVHFGVMLAHKEISPMNRIYLFNADARLFIRSGVIQAGKGNPFHDTLVNTFGTDGLKDFNTLKGLEVTEKPKLYTPQGT